jgi:hypothetical protein
VITHPQFHPRAQHPRRRGHDGRGSRLRQGYAALGSPPIELPRTVGLMDIPVERLRGFVEAIAAFWRDTEYIYNESIERKDPHLVARLASERAERSWVPQAPSGAA